MQQLLAQMAATPGFAALTPDQQKPILQNAFAQIDAAARQQIVSKIPNADLTTRVQENLADKATVPLLLPGPLRQRQPCVGLVSRSRRYRIPTPRVIQP
jgi:hypothetical protein